MTKPESQSPIDAIPEKVLPPASFLELFGTLSEGQKQIVDTFLYQSLKTCLTDERRILGGYNGRYQGIITSQTDIGIGNNVAPENILITDEQIIFGINDSNRYFDGGKFITRVGSNPEFYQIVEIYIDSSKMHRIAILQYLEERVRFPDAGKTVNHIIGQ